MANEPVKLKDLIQSLASTMVVTSQYLDQANVDLRNLYAHSGHGALASMAPPRFALDEMTIDLSFVVEEAAVVTPGRQPKPPTEKQALAGTQRRGMVEKLKALAKFEREMAQFLDQREKTRKALADAQKREKALRDKIKLLQAQVKMLRERLKKLKSNPFTRPLRGQLEAQIAMSENQLRALKQSLAGATQARSQLQAQLKAQKPPQKPPSVGSGPQPAALRDYAEEWAGFETAYDALKAAYVEATGAFEADRQLPRIGKFEPVPGDFGAVLKKAGVAEATRKSVESIRTDFEAALAALADLVSLVAALKGEGIRVRVDPESISKADDTARQHVRLTFRSESQETVQVEGEERDLP